MTAPPTSRRDGGPAASQAQSHLRISFVQVVAAALAAITATMVASFFGVTGTVIGAGISSVLTVVGTAVYGHSLRKTRERMHVVVPVARRRSSELAPAPATAPGPRPTFPRPPAERETADGYSPAAYSSRRWPLGTRLVLGAVVLFVAVLAFVTGVEVVAQRPVSDLVRGNNTVSGTTLFGSKQHAPSPTQQAPSRTTRPTPTVTRTVTRTASPSQPAPTQSAPSSSPTTAPSPSPANAAPSSATTNPSVAASPLG